jgi:predicted DNA-binding antitoxin AbrB/MazE fold protein
MHKLEITAVYEGGTLKLERALPLPEGQKVTVTVQPLGGAVRRLAGLIPWSGTREELEHFLSDSDAGILGHHEV